MLQHVLAVWGQRDGCLRAHQRIFERDGWRCTGSAPGGLRFEFGLRAGGPSLVTYGPGGVRAGTSACSLGAAGVGWGGFTGHSASYREERP